MIPVCAHIVGLPFEETVVQFLPAGFALLAALHAARERTRQTTTRIARAAARLRRSGRDN